MTSNDRSGLPGSRSLVDEMTECADDDHSDSSLETTQPDTSSQRRPLHNSLNAHESTSFSPYRPPQNNLSTQNFSSAPIAHSHNTRSHLRQFLPSLEKARLPLTPNSSIPHSDPRTIRSTHSTTNSVSMPSMTAAMFARDAPKAGFLYKEGKRRFFVLKPTTCLYYFASATDREPRGCIDLDSGTGVTLRESPSTSNGRLGFEIQLPTQDKHVPTNGPHPTTVIRLEAEDETAAREWMHLITVERLSHSKSVVESLSARVASLENDKKELYRQLDTFHLVEQDRDGAIQDAQGWKMKLEHLSQGIDMLRANMVEDASTNDWMQGKGLHKMEELGSDNTLLSQFIQENDLQSTHLFPLSHCYRNLKAKIHNEYQNFSTTKQDLCDALEKITELEAKVRQSEENMSKMYEENLELRESLKQTKKERKILAQEFRSLRKSFTDNQDETERLRNECEQLNSTLSSLRLEPGPADPRESNNFSTRRKALATPEKRLFFELEDSVTSTLIMNEQFLASQNPNNKFLYHGENALETHPVLSNHNATSEMSSLSPNRMISRGCKSLEGSSDVSQSSNGVSSRDSASRETKTFGRSGETDCRGKRVSLSTSPSYSIDMDDQGDKDISVSSPMEDDADKDISFSSQSVSPLRPKVLVSRDAISRLNTSLLDCVGSDDPPNDLQPREIIRFSESEDKIVTRYNQSTMTTIDDDHGASTASTIPCDSSAQSSMLSMRSLVTSNGGATLKLICPFVDVTETRINDDLQNEQIPDRGQVYHLTFYGSKIGIQFQKVPAESFNNSKLADAMRADLFDDGRRRTNMELQKVRTIANFNSTSDFDICPGDESSCPIVYPKDIVVVCGFHGFDELSNSNKRPHLGARLIAFDGISVEIGPWTFDSIRKSIQARGRPITLSFRNEYLSTKQRSILTKAVIDVNTSIPQPEQFSQYKIPELTSTLNSQAIERQHFDNSSEYVSSYNIPNRSDDHSDAESSITESAASPLNSRKAIPFSKQKGITKTWKSFSDAGSSTSSSKFASKFGPMMSNLVSTFNTNKESVPKPEYLSRIPNYVESRKDFQDYRASLL